MDVNWFTVSHQKQRPVFANIFSGIHGLYIMGEEIVTLAVKFPSVTPLFTVSGCPRGVGL